MALSEGSVGAPDGPAAGIPRAQQNQTKSQIPTNHLVCKKFCIELINGTSADLL